jgi:hypothetical protein
VKTLTPDPRPRFLYDTNNENPVLQVHLDAAGFREITHMLEKAADNRSECILSISASNVEHFMRITLACDASITKVSSALFAFDV